MGALPIYSFQLFSAHNFSGVNPIANDTGGTVIIRTITLYYDGDPPLLFFLNDQFTTTVVEMNMPGALTATPPFYQQLLNQHLVQPAGATWEAITDQGADYTLHGYILSGP